jgi:hypothetical protein
MADRNELVSAAEYDRKLKELEFHNERRDERISEIIREAVAMTARINALEQYTQSRAVIEAREDERDKALHDRLGRMEESMKETKTEIKGEINAIKGIVPRSLWIIATAIVSAAVALFVKSMFP